MKIRIFRIILVAATIGISISGKLHAQDPNVESKKIARFGISTKALLENDIKGASAVLNYWVDKISETVNLKIEGYVYTTMDSMWYDFKTAKLDMITVRPIDYLMGINRVEGELGPVPLRGGKKFLRYLVIVRSNSGIKAISDLKGKSLAIPKENEDGRFYLNALLLENNGKVLEEYFSDIIIKRTYAQAILAVFFGQADACLASDYALQTLGKLNEQVESKLKVIESSQEFLSSLTVFRKDLDESIKQAFMAAMMGLDKSPEGRQIKVLFMIDGMVQGLESDLEPLRQLIKRYVALKPMNMWERAGAAATQD